MRRAYLLLALAVLAGGCGLLDKTPKTVAGHVARYEDEFNTSIDFTVRVVPPDNPRLDGRDGICSVKEFAGQPVKKTVLISRNMTSDESLVFHELSHCRFRLGHDERKIERDGETIPRSIMYPDGTVAEFYPEHRRYYINELRAKIARVKD